MRLLVARVAYKMPLLLGFALNLAGTLYFGLLLPLALTLNTARFLGLAALEVGTAQLVDMIEVSFGMTGFSGPTALKVGAMYLIDQIKEKAGRRTLAVLVVSHQERTCLIDLVLVLVNGTAVVLGMIVVLKEGLVYLLDQMEQTAGRRAFAELGASHEGRICVVDLVMVPVMVLVIGTAVLLGMVVVSKEGAVYLVDQMKHTAGRRAPAVLVILHEGRTCLIDLKISMVIGSALLLGDDVVWEEGTMALVEVVALRAGVGVVLEAVGWKERRIRPDESVSAENRWLY